MDEGHIASAEEFEKYRRRLHSIFFTSDDIMVYLIVELPQISILLYLKTLNM